MVSASTSSVMIVFTRAGSGVSVVGRKPSEIRLKSVEVFLDGSGDNAPQLFVFGGLLESYPPSESRAAGGVLESHGHPEIVHRLQVVQDDALRRENFREVFLHLVVRAVGAVHGETPGATGPQIKFVKGVAEALGSPPVDEMVGIAECLKHEFAWRGKYAAADDSEFSRAGRLSVCCRCHGVNVTSRRLTFGLADTSWTLP